MTSPPDRASAPLSLATLDEAVVLDVDPGIWAANLAALRVHQPGLATALESAELPGTWRAVRALDGWATYRLEAPGAAPEWLAGTAVPRARAEGLIATIVPSEHNPTLAALGAGAELQLLLSRLPAHQAVFAFETSLHAMAAVLRVQPLDPSIRAGRCILVPPDGELAFLAAHLAAHPGLLPPGIILCLPEVPTGRLDEIRRTCETCAAQVHAQRRRRWQELENQVRAAHATPAEAGPLSLLALRAEPQSRFAATSLARAAVGAGIDLRVQRLEGPHDVHALAHLECLAAWRPGALLAINHIVPALPLPPDCQRCEWYLDPERVPERLPADGVLRLGASPRILAALRRAAGSDAPLPWYWGCEPGTLAGTGSAPDVLLVADLPDDDPLAAEVVQPSHKLLWECARRLVAQGWQRAERQRPGDLLARAERVADVHVQDEQVRATLCNALERVLIPATVVRRITQELRTHEIPFQVVGSGWGRPGGPEVQSYAGSLLTIAGASQRPQPSAAIFVGLRDPLAPGLLQAAAWGWPVLLHAVDPAAAKDGLAPVVQPGTHVQLFGTAKELLRLLALCRRHAPAVARQVAAAVQHLAQHHSFALRLAQLTELLRSVRRNIPVGAEPCG